MNIAEVGNIVDGMIVFHDLLEILTGRLSAHRDELPGEVALEFGIPLMGLIAVYEALTADLKPLVADVMVAEAGPALIADLERFLGGDGNISD